MGKKRVLVGYGVDIDAVAGWLGSYGGEDSVNDISRGTKPNLHNIKAQINLAQVSGPATSAQRDFSSSSPNTTSKPLGSSPATHWKHSPKNARKCATKAMRSDFTGIPTRTQPA